MFQRLVAAAALALLALAPSAARAGASQTVTPYCVTASWGGECLGQLSSFLSSPDTTAFAQFSASGPNASFYAVLGGQTYQCSVNQTSPFLGTIGQAAVMPASNYFFIWWDTSGTCQSITISNSSRFR